MDSKSTFDYQIKTTWLSIFKMYNQVATQHDFSQAAANVLLNINHKEGTPSTQIALNMGMEATSLSRLLKNMEGDSLICRKTDGLDKRKVIIMLTDKGLENRKKAVKVVKEFNNKIKKRLSEKQSKTFFEVMNLINGTTEEYKLEKTI